MVMRFLQLYEARFGSSFSSDFDAKEGKRAGLVAPFPPTSFTWSYRATSARHMSDKKIGISNTPNTQTTNRLKTMASQEERDRIMADYMASVQNDDDDEEEDEDELPLSSLT